MDIRMPVFDGIEATAQLRQAAETIAVLVLTTFGEDEVLWGALEAGAASATERRRSCSLTTTVSSRPGRQTRRVARGRGARQRQVDHLEPAGGGAHAASSATSPAAPGARAAQAIGLLTFFPLYLLGGGGPPKGAMYGVMHTISNAFRPRSPRSPTRRSAFRASAHSSRRSHSGRSPRSPRSTGSHATEQDEPRVQGRGSALLSCAG